MAARSGASRRHFLLGSKCLSSRSIVDSAWSSLSIVTKKKLSTGKQKTQSERRLYEATSGSGLIPLNPILNAISGRTKKLKSHIAIERKELCAESLESKFSGYFIFKNKGYGTKEHFSSLKENGITHLHRKSFLTKLNPV